MELRIDRPDLKRLARVQGGFDLGDGARSVARGDAYTRAHARGFGRQRAIDARDPCLVDLAVAPQWDPLRGDARFARCLAKMGLTDRR